VKPRRQRLELLAAILGVLYRRNLGALETVDFRRRIIWIRHVKSDCRIGFHYHHDPRARLLVFAGCETSVLRLESPPTPTGGKKQETGNSKPKT
jgi:hypothetical protein